MFRRLRIATVLTIAATTLPGLAPAPTGASTPPPSLTPDGRLIRRNVLELTAPQRDDFVAAVRKLKTMPSPYDERFSYYDQFVAWHVSLYRCESEVQAHAVHAGHNGPFFLPWHRAFVDLFEEALGAAAGRPMAVPYWDWADPASRATVFSSSFMGGDGDPSHRYAVTDGPFGKGTWHLNVQPEGVLQATSRQPYLVRKLGAAPPPVDDVVWALNAPRYDEPPYDTTVDPNLSFRNAMEGWWRNVGPVRVADPVHAAHCGPDGWMFPSRDGGKLHNQLHTYVGGVVADPLAPTVFGTMITMASPNDPLFFLHHANIDRLYAKWQARHGAPFAPMSEAAHLMEPFRAAGRSFSPASVTDIGALGYTYSDYVDSDDKLVPMPATPAPAASTPATYNCPVR